MKTKILPLAVLTLSILGNTLVATLPVEAATLYLGSKITFVKPTGADFTQAQYQDRITDLVWLTRGNVAGLYNIKQESAFDKNSADPLSPVDTEWAYGTTANVGSLVFSKWKTWSGNAPFQTVGLDAVLHLITDDIYIDIKFLSWDQRAGGFSYERSTAAPTAEVPEPSSLIGLLGLGLMGAFRRRSKQ
jgi:hypothetical protein